MSNDLNIKFYQSQIMMTKCGKYQGSVIKAKPVLLLAVFDCIADGVISDNKILMTDKFINYYETSYMRYMPNEKISVIQQPFYFLKNDNYWHLTFSQEPTTPKCPSLKFLRENSYASFDTAFWDILQTAENLVFFKRLVIEKFFNTDN